MFAVAGAVAGYAIGGTAAAAGVGATAGAALGSAYSSHEAAKAQEEAAQTQAEAARKAQDTELEMYYQSRADYAPYRETGTSALNKLRDYPDFQFQMQEPSDIYEYRLGEGRKEVDRALGSMGRYGSSARVNALADLSSRLTAEESRRQYERQYGQYQNKYNQLLNLTNIGRGATTQSAQAAMQTGSNLANLQVGAGNALAQGQLGAGQQKASMYSNLSAMPMQVLNAYKQQQFYNNMANQGYTGTGANTNFNQPFPNALSSTGY